jgi:hypothetical protein
LNHDITGSLVSTAEREVLFGWHRDVVSDHVFLEGVSRSGSTTVRQVVSRVALEQEVEDTSAVGDGRVILRLDDHAVLRRCGTGGLQLVGSGDANQANTTVAYGRKLGVPTESRDVDAPSTCRVEDGVIWRDGECTTIDCE